MTLKKCPICGAAAAIRIEKTGRQYSVMAICEGCGNQGKSFLDKQEPAAGAASIYMAGLSWNCGIFKKQEVRA